MLNREGDTQDDEWHTYIAGVSYHISKYDIGGFTGWIENDINNAHDSKAMGIYNSFGKLLGYIPAKELLDYRLWCDSKPQPCIGFVYIEDGQYRGRVKYFGLAMRIFCKPNLAVICNGLMIITAKNIFRNLCL